MRTPVRHRLPSLPGLAVRVWGFCWHSCLHWCRECRGLVPTLGTQASTALPGSLLLKSRTCRSISAFTMLQKTATLSSCMMLPKAQTRVPQFILTDSTSVHPTGSWHGPETATPVMTTLWKTKEETMAGGEAPTPEPSMEWHTPSGSGTPEKMETNITLQCLFL